MTEQQKKITKLQRDIKYLRAEYASSLARWRSDLDKHKQLAWAAEEYAEAILRVEEAKKTFLALVKRAK